MNLTQHTLDELKRLGDTAPPGEWTSDRDRFTGKWWVFGEDGDSFAVVNEALGHGVELCHAEDTAAYIVAARPELTREMVELIAEWKGALDEFIAYYPSGLSPQLDAAYRKARAALALLKE